jgi:hypothetical protein
MKGRGSSAIRQLIEFNSKSNAYVANTKHNSDRFQNMDSNPPSRGMPGPREREALWHPTLVEFQIHARLWQR